MRGPRAIPDSEYRWESIQQVAGEIGLEIDPSLVIRIDSAGWSMKTGYHPMAPEIGYKPMQALLKKTHDFTAIFCFNDIAAIGAIRALNDAGLRVPGRCFRGRFRRYPVRGLLHAIADNCAPAIV